ncbi:MAG: nitroreductase family protein [Clostridia bacterium]|nr:nitroreductase family protein [Clostridia bacterium]
MTFIELAKSRFSERHFDARPVEEEKLKLILEAGRVAPTACNYQPQVVYVIKSKEAMEKAKSTHASLCGCPVALLVCYDSETVWRNPRDRCYENYNAGEQDASIVAASMMFEAEELGVHSLWIRGFDSQDVIDAFGLPANHIPVMMLALGYPGEKSHPAHLHEKRRPLSETVREL